MNLDPLLALAAAAVVSVLATFNVLDEDVERQAVLAVLAVLAFTLLRERSSRRLMSSELHGLARAVRALDRSAKKLEADDLFALHADESDVIARADGELFVVQETGNMLFDRERSNLISLLAQSASIKIVIACPTRGTAGLMALRNRDLSPAAIMARYTSAIAQIERILHGAEPRDGRRLELRFTPYPVDFTVIMADPNHAAPARRRAVVRLAGFKVTYDKKLDFPVDGSGSPRAFHLYQQQVADYFSEASKVVLLTGVPHAGKTTLLEDVLEGLARDPGHDPDLLYRVITRAATRGPDRTGFTVETSEHEGHRLSTKQQDGTYEIDQQVIDGVAEEISDAHARGKIVVVDEIGPHQISNRRFREAIQALIDDPSATLIATIAVLDGDAFVSSVKGHPRATVIELAPERSNVEHCRERLTKELSASIRLASYVPRVLWTT